MKEKEAQEKKNNINILINKKGGLLVNGKATSIKKLKEVLDNIKLDKDKAHVLINGDKKTKTGDITDIKVILRESGFYKISINNKLLPPPPPMSIVGHYKQLFKKGSKTKIYKQKDVQKMISLYKKMSKKEQQGVTDIRKVIPPPPPKNSQEKTTFHKNWFITIDGQKYFYTFDKNERVARYYKNGKLVKLDIVKEYKKKHKIFEQLKNTGQHYVFKSASEKKVIDREFSDLGGMYFRMPRADKNKVPFPNNPHGEYAKIRRKDGSHYYKKRSELNAEDKKLLNRRLPPPPALKKNATKKEIERYNKAYKFWKEKTKRLPPPPPKAKKATKAKIREIEEKPEIIEIEEIIETPIIKEVEEIVEERELIEEKEIEEVIEVEETIESPEIVEQEIVTIDKLNGLTNDEIIDINDIQNPDIKKVYYLNGKKISEKKYKKLKLKSIKKLFIKSKADNIKHVYITTK